MEEEKISKEILMVVNLVLMMTQMTETPMEMSLVHLLAAQMVLQKVLPMKTYWVLLTEICLAHLMATTTATSLAYLLDDWRAVTMAQMKEKHSVQLTVSSKEMSLGHLSAVSTEI